MDYVLYMLYKKQLMLQREWICKKKANILFILIIINRYQREIHLPKFTDILFFLV